MKTIMTKTTTLVLTALTLTIALAAQAGPSDRGGADSAEKPTGGRTILDLVEKDEVEYFNPDILTTGLFGKIVDRFQPQGNALRVQFSRCRGGELDPTGRDNLRWAWTDEALEDLIDEGAIRVDNTDTKRQLAIQKGKLVLVNRSEYKLIDEDGRSALRLHEELICAIKRVNPYYHSHFGTENIRRLVRAYKQVGVDRKPEFLIWDAYELILPYLSKISSDEYSEYNFSQKHRDTTLKFSDMQTSSKYAVVTVSEYVPTKFDTTEKVELRVNLLTLQPQFSPEPTTAKQQMALYKAVRADLEQNRTRLIEKIRSESVEAVEEMMMKGEQLPANLRDRTTKY